MSHVFRSSACAPGDHVALCLENHPRYLAPGAHYAGLYYTAMSSRLTTDEMAYIVEDCRAAGVRDLGLQGRPGGRAGRVGDDVALYMMDGTIEGYEAGRTPSPPSPPPPLDEDRVEGRDMLYSSGTTGRPKGVEAPLPDAALGTPDADVCWPPACSAFHADSVYLSPAPLYHAAPLRFCMGFHRAGGTVVVMEHFDPERRSRLIERYRVTHSQLVPTMFVRMLKLPDRGARAYDVSSLQAPSTPPRRARSRSRSR